MTTASLLAIVLAVVVAVAGLRLLQQARRTSSRAWRLPVLLLGQVASAVLLYFALVPPPVTGRTGVLVVLTAGAETPPKASTGDIVVALPEAPAAAGAERVPDLGTALRRHPGARSLRIVGSGLPPRDRDAARGMALAFEAAALPPGLIALSAPVSVQRGRRFTVAGRVSGAGKRVVDLLDPGGRRIDRADAAKDGAFLLSGQAGPPGRVAYRLQLREAAGESIEEIALPVQVVEAAPLRVLLLAGGASPELKYLRRWATDAGIALHTQISLGGGVELGDPPVSVNAATLVGFDLAVLDERAWQGLGDGGRAALREAVRGGLGVLLRITGDLSARDRQALRDWGFDLQAAELTRTVMLAGTEMADAGAAVQAGDDAARATDTAPLLTRRPLRLGAADGAPLLRDASGGTLALWRPEGRGRVAAWVLSDSFRLALAGRRAAYGSLWAETFATLARPRGKAPPPLPGDARVGERTMLCGITDAMRLHGSDGETIPLALDPASGARRCAAFWPAQAGWHELRDGEQAWAFPVRAGGDSPALQAAERRAATLALVANLTAKTDLAPTWHPGPRWPWLQAWLLVSAGLWWLERSRAGRGS